MGIGEGDAYIPYRSHLANSTPILHRQRIFRLKASWLFSNLVMSHRGISLKIIGVKTVYDVASGDALFISELGPLRKIFTGYRRRFQKWNGTAQVKDTEAEKLFRIRRRKSKNNLIRVAEVVYCFLQDAAGIWK